MSRLNLVTVLLSCMGVASSAQAADDLRCGAFSLYVALKAAGLPVQELSELERKLGVPGKAGHSLGQLQDVAESYGAHTLAVQAISRSCETSDQHRIGAPVSAKKPRRQR